MKHTFSLEHDPVDISRRISEKITFKEPETGNFVGREFSASRTLTLPDGAPPELIEVTERRLDYDLRKQVLVNFVLEQVITADSMKAALGPYKALLDRAEQQWERVASETNPKPDFV